MKWLSRLFRSRPTHCIRLNGVECPLDANQTLADIAHNHAKKSSRVVAAAINGKVVPKAQWSRTMLAPGDRIRLVTPIASG